MRGMQRVTEAWGATGAHGPAPPARTPRPHAHARVRGVRGLRARAGPHRLLVLRGHAHAQLHAHARVRGVRGLRARAGPHRLLIVCRHAHAQLQVLLGQPQRGRHLASTPPQALRARPVRLGAAHWWRAAAAGCPSAQSARADAVGVEARRAACSSFQRISVR